MRTSLSNLQEGKEGVVVEIRLNSPGSFAESKQRRPIFGWLFGKRFRWRWRFGWRGGGAGCGAVKRLADLGILAGSRIKVVRRAPLGGPIEIEVAGSRFMIGRWLAERIIVEVD